jgi:hypothetical protein
VQVIGSLILAVDPLVLGTGKKVFGDGSCPPRCS